eukprot:TRINITY_DN10847_c0_g1_i2.p1 TRINITY_DN10847_c0_g1~~TRINITY_DN10847_c0_g1_i2.p1  ORF type:complete len:507 (+),score=21.96 TRINITY_DN10847_c0_g1_i2:56-1576(+)
MLLSKTFVVLRAAFVTHWLLGALSRVLVAVSAVAVVVCIRATNCSPEGYGGEVNPGFWLRTLQTPMTPVPWMPFVRVRLHAMLLKVDLLVLIAITASIFMKFLNMSSVKKVFTRDGVTASVILKLVKEQAFTCDGKRELVDLRDWTLRNLNYLSLFWYLPFLYLIDAFQRAARRKSWALTVAVLDVVLLVIKTSRPQWWTLGMNAYVLGRIDRCDLYGRCTFTMDDVIEIIICVLPLAFYQYGINDLNDIEGDLVNGRKLGPEHNDSEMCYYDPKRLMHKKRLLIRLLWAALAILFLWMLLRASIVQCVAMMLMVFLGWAYSAPPLRLKEVPFLDIWIQGSYGIVYFLGLAHCWSIYDSRQIGGHFCRFVYSCFLPHTLHCCIDRDADRKVGYRTTIVRYGLPGFAVLYWLTAIILMFFEMGAHACCLDRAFLFKQTFLRFETVWMSAVLTTVVSFLNYLSNDVLFRIVIKDFMLVHFYFVFGRILVTQMYISELLYESLPDTWQS